MNAAHPLFGKRVLVTRPGHQAADFAARLREIGAEPILAPTIAIGPPDDPAPARAAAARAEQYAWIVFTSRNGVDAFFTARRALGRNANSLERVRWGAIGPRTAAALAARAVRVDLFPSTHVSEAIATDLLIHTARGDRVLIFAAQEARDVLAVTLRAYGRRVDAVAAYRTTYVAEPDLAANAARADIVTFTSASTVGGFVAGVPDALALLRGKMVAAIGPVTALAARDAGIRVDTVADTFTVEGLVRALAAAAIA